MTCLVTGSTGLVGSALVKAIAARGGHVVAAARSVEKARRMFGGVDGVEVVEWDVMLPFDESILPCAVDCMVHAAAETASRNMVQRPVETMAVTLEGTRNALDLARRLGLRGMVFLSSMEVYGSPQDGKVISEGDVGPLDHLAPRSSYPLSKRMAEGMCAAYAREYGIPVCIARLAQVIGSELMDGDARVISQFARSVAAGEDLVLHTDGASARCYCAIDDAVDAVLLLLERGAAGEAYNVANEGTYCSIRELAEMLCERHPRSHVVIRPVEGMGYAPASRLRLSAAKLEGLGWRPRVGLMEAYDRLIASRREG